MHWTTFLWLIYLSFFVVFYSIYNTEWNFIKLHLAMILFSCDMNGDAVQVTVWLFSQKNASHEILKF